MTGVLGGYTTFSAFSLDLMTLWERGEPWPALVYGLASVLGSVIAVGAGLFLIRSIAA
jgi:CrcB protein|nr:MULTISPECIES: CrcB family protein [unclassified Devosia]